MNIIENEYDEKETDANRQDQVISLVQNSNMKNKSRVNPSFAGGSVDLKLLLIFHQLGT